MSATLAAKALKLAACSGRKYVFIGLWIPFYAYIQGLGTRNTLLFSVFYEPLFCHIFRMGLLTVHTLK